MKHTLLLLLLVAVIQGQTQEMPYTLSVLQQPFTPLEEAVSAVNGEYWDDQEAIFIPIGFTFDFMDESTTSLLLEGPGAQLINAVDEDEVNFFEPYLADLIDAGNDSTSLSPISYTTEGPMGARIFKMEWKDAAFYYEVDALGTSENKISFQLWLYESSNIIEYRYGPNTVTDGGEVHFYGNPIIAIGKNAVNNGGWEAFWILSGDPLNPQVISYTDKKQFPPTLDAEPADGTVYRFAPIIDNSVETLSNNLLIYPSLTSDQITIGWNGSKTNATIFSSWGSKVMSVQLMPGQQRIDVSSLATGQYYIQTLDANQSFQGKFFKQ